MSETTKPTRRFEAGLRVVLLAGLVLDAAVLRTVMAGREAFLLRFSGRLPAYALGYAIFVVAATAHVVLVARDARREATDSPRSRDARSLRVGAGILAAVYLAFHALVGPLGVALRGGDAFTLYDSLRRSFPTYPAAILHAAGLVALGAHAFELVQREAPVAFRARAAATSVVLSVAYGAFVLDPVALLTIGRTLFVRADPAAGIFFPEAPRSPGAP